MKRTILVLSVLVVAAAPAFAQMEKRLRVLYDREAFRKRAPALGVMMPELKLRGLDGKPVKLSSFRKKPLVVIGGAYT